MVGDLIGDLVGSDGLTEGGEEGGKQELDEGGGIACLVAGGEDLVVFGLLIADDRLDRKEGEDLVPVAEDEGLPESADAAIAIGKGVDELEFVVKDAARNERMGVGVAEPAEKILHEPVDPVRRRSDVNDALAFGDADCTGAEFSGVIDKTPEHQSVSGEQVFQ